MLEDIEVPADLDLLTLRLRCPNRSYLKSQRASERNRKQNRSKSVEKRVEIATEMAVIRSAAISNR